MNSITEENDSKRMDIGGSFRHWLKFLFQPKQFFSAINAKEIRSWAFPMILLTITFILYSVGQGVAISRGGQTQTAGWAVFSESFSNLAVIWTSWLWMCGILSSFLILAGIRFPKSQTRLIIAWTMSPLLFRGLIRLVYILITGEPIQNPGMSGFLDQPSGFLPIFIGQVLAQIDLYLFWQMALFWIGLKSIPSLRPTQRRFAFVITLINMITVYGLIKTLEKFLQNLQV